MLVGPGYLELVHEIAYLKAGSRVGLVCGSDRGAENMLETLQLSGATGIEIVPALLGDEAQLDRVDEVADLILMSREALAAGLDGRFARPGADPALELRVRSVRPRAPAPRDRARRRRAAGRGDHRLTPAGTCHTRPDMERIPLRRAALDRLGCERALAQDPRRPGAAEARKLVRALNATRPAESRQAVSGDLLALSLLHEAAHRAIVAGRPAPARDRDGPDARVRSAPRWAPGRPARCSVGSPPSSRASGRCRPSASRTSSSSSWPTTIRPPRRCAT